MPAVEMAVKTAWNPPGLSLLGERKNPWLVKLIAWNAVTRNRMITTMMTASFHHTSTLFTCAKSLTPITLITQNTASSTMAATNPGPVSVCTVSPLTVCASVKWYHFVAYCRVPVTSIAGTTAAAIQVIQPIE